MENKQPLYFWEKKNKGILKTVVILQTKGFDIQFGVVKFFGFFNENFLSFFLQLECCVIWGMDYKTTYML